MERGPDRMGEGALPAGQGGGSPERQQDRAEVRGQPGAAALRGLRRRRVQPPAVLSPSPFAKSLDGDSAAARRESPAAHPPPPLGGGSLVADAALRWPVAGLRRDEAAPPHDGAGGWRPPGGRFGEAPEDPAAPARRALGGGRAAPAGRARRSGGRD